MSKIDTIKRSFFTLALLFLVVPSVAGQSVLNFPRAVANGTEDTGLALTNPSPYFADVQFTLFGADGNPVENGAVNPVGYRIAPKSQIQMQVSRLFVTGNAQGWIQATSSSSGLIGYYFNGDYSETLEGTESSMPMLDQVIPLIREDQTTHTELVVANSTASTVTVNVTFNNGRGDVVGTAPQTLSPHASYTLKSTPPGATTARVTSSIAVTALAVVSDSDSLMYVTAQSVDPSQAATTRVIPHFLSGNGYDSELVLSNPTGSATNVNVALFSQTGTLTQPARLTVIIPARGSVSLTAAAIAGRIISPLVDGWVEIESPNQVLNGVLRLDSGRALTTIPLQRVSMDRMLFSQSIDTSDFYSEYDFVNTTGSDASLEITLMRVDGSLVMRRVEKVPARSKYTKMVRDVFPEGVGLGSGFVSIRSSAGIYGVEILGGTNLHFLATIVPQRINQDFVPKDPTAAPRIVRVEPSLVISPGMQLRIFTSEITTSDVQILLGSLTVTPRVPVPGSTLLTVDVPALLEPGFANVRVRVRGAESAPVLLQVVTPGSAGLATVSGQAFYQKVEVTDAGLDPAKTTMVPIRSARVEVLDAATAAVVSVSETDDRGQFNAAVPPEAGVRIRVLSRLRSTALRVLDNTDGDKLYDVSMAFDLRETPQGQPLVVDRSRVSGAFNILEMIQRGNDLLHLADVTVIPPAPAIFWSTRNTKALIGTTLFNVATNTAKILGDRNDDSDEFDDGVIIHEYAHMLAARFSRDDSPGGEHHIGDILDPRLAWSEGWANFFSSAARNDAVYRDSGVRGVNVRIDLEDNHPPNDNPGYWSEASIGSLLWDLFDSQNEADDTATYPITMIWNAVTDIKNDRFVYLPYFLERFTARYPAEAEVLRNMAVARSIDFQPNVRPSVSMPFPRVISAGFPVQGEVNSYKDHRTNLSTSAHFFTFATTGEQVAIRLDIKGIASGGSASFNDLDLFLMDMDGRVIDQSDRGLNGQSELINRRLPAGSYVIEVRSYYKNADTNTQVFNSAKYQLGVMTQ